VKKAFYRNTWCEIVNEDKENYHIEYKGSVAIVSKNIIRVERRRMGG